MTAWCRSDLFNRSDKSLAGRLRYRDTLEDLLDKDMGLYRRQTFSNRTRVYAESEHRPGVARSFGLNHDLSDHSPVLGANVCRKGYGVRWGRSSK